MDANQGLQAIKIVNPRHVIPVHYDDYEVFKSPLDDFKAAVATAGLEDRVTYLSRGETYHFPLGPTAQPTPPPAAQAAPAVVHDVALEQSSVIT